jgi:DNA-directed RNA polymerase I, II, and III subunit RPABC1
MSEKKETSEAEIARLFKIKKTELQMLEARGYDVERDKNIQYESFKQSLQIIDGKIPKLNFYGNKINDESSTIFVEYIVAEKLTVDHITKFCIKLKEKNIPNGIIIISGSITSMARQKLKETNDSKLFHIELFEDKELIVNITEHELVPKHIILSDEEKQTLLKKYRLKESQLPKILTTDPVARFLGLVKGQVVKIIRASETAGRYITYRIAQ